jgi:hypothetical protein
LPCEINVSWSRRYQISTKKTILLLALSSACLHGTNGSSAKWAKYLVQFRVEKKEGRLDEVIKLYKEAIGLLDDRGQLFIA